MIRFCLESKLDVKEVKNCLKTFTNDQNQFSSVSTNEINFIVDLLQLQGLQNLKGEETGFTTDAKNSLEKLSELLNLEITFLEKFLSIFLLNSAEKINQSVKTFNW